MSREQINVEKEKKGEKLIKGKKEAFKTMEEEGVRVWECESERRANKFKFVRWKETDISITSNDCGPWYLIKSTTQINYLHPKI